MYIHIYVYMIARYKNLILEKMHEPDVSIRRQESSINNNTTIVVSSVSNPAGIILQQ